ncbi:MAG TPA: hypothetical protein VLE99_04050 [Candidatus Saccharimonadales bacterium]|nr:hypothetical protein [Candidatus Saccharimonadales bacterium]
MTEFADYDHFCTAAEYHLERASRVRESKLALDGLYVARLRLVDVDSHAARFPARVTWLGVDGPTPMLRFVLLDVDYQELHEEPLVARIHDGMIDAVAPISIPPEYEATTGYLSAHHDPVSSSLLSLTNELVLLTARS